MEPLGVVVPFNEVKYLCGGILLTLKGTPLQQLCFEPAKERLCESVVVRVIRLRHTLQGLVLVKQCAEGMASILPAPVGMDNQATWWFTLVNGHVQRLAHQ